jgi:hypothetical protein
MYIPKRQSEPPYRDKILREKEKKQSAHSMRKEKIKRKKIV